MTVRPEAKRPSARRKSWVVTAGVLRSVIVVTCPSSNFQPGGQALGVVVTVEAIALAEHLVAQGSWGVVLLGQAAALQHGHDVVDPFLPEAQRGGGDDVE